MRTPRSIFSKLELKAPDMSKTSIKTDNALAYRERHDAFYTMLRAALQSSRFDVNSVICEWWYQAFEEPIPSGVTLEKAAAMIQYKLLGDGSKDNDYELPKSFWSNYEKAIEGGRYISDKTVRNIFEGLKVNKQQTIITQEKEYGMAKVQKVSKEEKSSSKSKMSRDEMLDLIAELLMKRKFTDDEIVEKVNDAAKAEVCSESKVSGLRRYINKHPKETGCPDAAKNPLEKIGDEKPKKSNAVERAGKAIKEIEEEVRSPRRGSKEEPEDDAPVTHESPRSARRAR